MLVGKKFIVIGDKNGIPGKIIAECLKAAGGEIILTAKDNFLSSRSEKVLFYNQQQILDAVEEYRGQEVLAILGSATPELAEINGELVTVGDPFYQGPLAEKALGLPVYHICEDEIKEMLPLNIYFELVAGRIPEMEVEQIKEVLRDLRENYSELPEM
jgi:hypothetical protein